VIAFRHSSVTKTKEAAVFSPIEKLEKPRTEKIRIACIKIS